MKSITLAMAMVAAVKAAQPPGVSDPIYNCTYEESAVQLVVHVDGHEAECICGAEDDVPLVYVQPRDFTIAPTVALAGQDLDLESYYTLILSNPDDFLIDGRHHLPVIGPIIHEFVGNIKGSAFVEGDLSYADNVIPWYAPHPVGAHEVAHFCYLVYKQEQLEDYADVAEMDETLFPVRDVAERHNLTLLTSNYYAASKP